jgi:hypothetical protein
MPGAKAGAPEDVLRERLKQRASHRESSCFLRPEYRLDHR